MLLLFMLLLSDNVNDFTYMHSHYSPVTESLQIYFCFVYFYFTKINILLCIFTIVQHAVANLIFYNNNMFI